MIPSFLVPQQLTLSPRVRQVLYLVIALAWVLTQALVPVLGASSRLIVCLSIAVPLLASLFLGVAAAHVYTAPTGAASSSDAGTPPATPVTTSPSTPVNPDLGAQAAAPAWTAGNALGSGTISSAPTAPAQVTSSYPLQAAVPPAQQVAP